MYAIRSYYERHAESRQQDLEVPPLDKEFIDAYVVATAIAHEKSRLFVVNRRDLEDLLFVDRDLAYELLWNFVRTLSIMPFVITSYSIHYTKLYELWGTDPRSPAA